MQAPASTRPQPRRAPGLTTDKRRALAQARRQEIATLVLRTSVVLVLFAVIGQSQALSAIWLKCLWSLLPPAAFLVAVRVESWPPNPRFPYGFYRVTSIAFLTAALALAAMGAYLSWTSMRALIIPPSSRLPTMSMTGAGLVAWPGWWVIAGLAYSVMVPLVIGRHRKTHAIALHDKGLYADASMGRMNARAGLIAIVGVLGIGLGLEWLDFAASLAIGLDILWQGTRHLRTAVCDLMDEVPRRIATNDIDPLGERIRTHLAACDWVDDVRVRLREEGRLLTGVALIAPDVERAALADFDQARHEIEAMDWRLLDFQLVPVAAAEFSRFCVERRPS